MNKKIYLIYFDWPNTSGNHAGMAYLSKKLDINISDVHAIKMFSPKNKYLRVVNVFYVFFWVFILKFKLKKNDKVVLMEYLARSTFQDYFAQMAKILSSEYKIYGLVHLSSAHLLEIYKSKNVIREKVKYLDHVLVFGSSLGKFFEEIGFKDKIIQTFHYVDTEYYCPNDKKEENDQLTVICMGNIKRDYFTLKEIVQRLPLVNFNICQGFADLNEIFSDCQNVTLHGFLPENDLKGLMQKADVSLSIMEDTIGSNVITTSLSCGLVQIVSDVGSIRDYCTEEDTFFCNSKEDFINAFNLLVVQPELVMNMKKSARLNAAKFSLPNFINYFSKYIIND